MKLVAGQIAEPRTYGPITRTDIVRYAGASGDFNPIHHDEVFATGAGFPTVFSIGMFQAALLATYVTDWLGVETIRRYSVRFMDQVWPNDELTCTGVVTKVEQTPEGELIEAELTCTRQNGSVAIAGMASFLRV